MSFVSFFLVLLPNVYSRATLGVGVSSILTTTHPFPKID